LVSSAPEYSYYFVYSPFYFLPVNISDFGCMHNIYNARFKQA
jgi:hypothetical protein